MPFSNYSPISYRIAPSPPPPSHRAHLKRSSTEVKWQGASAWAKSKVTRKKYRHSRLREPSQKPNSGLANANERPRCEALPAEDGPLPHWQIPRVDEEACPPLQVLVVPLQDPDAGVSLQVQREASEWEPRERSEREEE